jgi:predicted MFS family arabinose efflux permease
MVFALYRLALNVGSTAAPLLGAALILVSYNLLFWGEAVTSTAYAVIALAALPPRAPRQAEEGGSVSLAGRWALAAVLADRRYALFLFALLINAMVYVQYLSVLPLAMRADHLAVAWYAFAVAMNAAIVITCELLMTKLTQRWPARVVALIGFALLGFGQALYSVPAGLVVFIGGTLIWTLAEIIAGPTMLAYPANAGPPRLKSQYVGASQAVFTLGFAIGPALGVLGWNLIGGRVWWLCGVVSLLGLALAWYGMRKSDLRPVP